MQLFSADAAMFSLFFTFENLKKHPKKLLMIGQNFFFQYYQPAQIQPKS